MAEDAVRAERIGRRAKMRWCLAGSGALLILAGLAMGIGSSAAGTGHGRGAAPPRHAPRHPSHRLRAPARHAPHGSTTTIAGPATGSGGGLPAGASDGISVGSAAPLVTTLPTVAPTTPEPVQSLAAGDLPDSTAVPAATAGAVLLLVLGAGAFGWAMRRPRARLRRGATSPGRRR